MNKETGKLYDKFLTYVFKYIPSDGDGRLECEGMLVNLIDNLDKWISVKKKLPKDEKRLLVWTDEGKFGEGWYAQDAKCWVTYDVSGDVIHYQNLQPPKDN